MTKTDSSQASEAIYEDLLDRDSRPEGVPPTFRWQDDEPIGPIDIPRERYISRDFHLLEKEKMWKRTWQMACREEDIPDVGDTVVYDICELSFLIVRVGEDEIKAFYNACLHRGRQLKDDDGNNFELRCSFHGYCWNLDGSLKQIPTPWDFPHVDPQQWHLPEVKVGTWGGFVFINMDPTCESLEEFLGNWPEQFERWPFEKRYKKAHVAKIFEANWKVVQEAFMESLHVTNTHPQFLPNTGDTITRLLWQGNWSLAITPLGTPSPNLAFTPTEQEIYDAYTDRRLDEDPHVVLSESATARATVGEWGRRRLRGMIGDEADQLSDAEMIDAINFTLFPNFHPWGGYNRMCYRFRPYGDRHDMSIMECMFLEPYDESQPKPPPAPIHWLDADDDWTAAPELKVMARVFNQDSFNLPKVQKGLASSQKDVTLSQYQELKIRHFHHLLTQKLSE